MGKRLLVYRMVLVTLFVIGLGMIAGGLWGVSNLKRIDKEYISTTAKIEKINKHTRRSNRKNYTTYEVIITYVANEKAYRGKLNSYNSFMRVGDSLQLKYNPRRVTDIRSVETENLLFMVMIIAGTIVLISTLFMPRLFKKLKFIN